MMKYDILVRIETFKEGNQYVSLCPELNVSSFGDTIEGSEKSLQEALNLFIEEIEEMGTLEEILEEAGFVRLPGTPVKWAPREPVKTEIIELPEAASG